MPFERNNSKGPPNRTDSRPFLASAKPRRSSSVLLGGRVGCIATCDSACRRFPTQAPYTTSLVEGRKVRQARRTVPRCRARYRTVAVDLIAHALLKQEEEPSPSMRPLGNDRALGILDLALNRRGSKSDPRASSGSERAGRASHRATIPHTTVHYKIGAS